MNAIEVARLAAGVLNVANLSSVNADLANTILLRALTELDKLTTEASLASSGIIT